jgi:pimeloyl-ACP methyl ester carboxylesterase
VILGGHSLGSTIVITEAARHHDADAVLLTGFSHSPNPVGLGALFATLVPAALDPRFAGSDVGYLTTRPGTRGVFYGDSDVTPAIAAYDEATKDVVSVAEVPGAVGTTLPVPPLLLAANLPPTDRITSPVLLVNGSDDRQFCSAATNCAGGATFDATERPYFPRAAEFETRLISGAGHDLTLSSTTPEFQEAVLEWARRTVPSTSVG